MSDLPERPEPERPSPDECWHCEGQPTRGWIETPYGCQMQCFVCNPDERRLPPRGTARAILDHLAGE